MTASFIIGALVSMTIVVQHFSSALNNTVTLTDRKTAISDLKNSHMRFLFAFCVSVILNCSRRLSLLVIFIGLLMETSASYIFQKMEWSTQDKWFQLSRQFSCSCYLQLLFFHETHLQLRLSTETLFFLLLKVGVWCCGHS